MRMKKMLVFFIFVLFLSVFSTFLFASQITVNTNITVGCGDGNCRSEHGETCSSCLEDCGPCPVTTTAPAMGGGGMIIPTTTTTTTSTTTTTTSTTTISPEIICGNGVCEAGENCGNCLIDCPCASGEECIDDVCRSIVTPVAITPPVPLGVWLLTLIIIIGIVLAMVYIIRSRRIAIPLKEEIPEEKTVEELM